MDEIMDNILEAKDLRFAWSGARGAGALARRPPAGSRGWPDLRATRTQRRRQDDADQAAHRVPSAACGPSDAARGGWCFGGRAAVPRLAARGRFRHRELRAAE